MVILKKYKQSGVLIFNCFQHLHLYDWPCLSKAIFIAQACFVYKIINMQYSPELKSTLNFNTNINYNLRNNQNLMLTRYNKNIGQKSFTYWASKLWNSLSINIRKSPTINIFKGKI